MGPEPTGWVSGWGVAVVDLYGIHTTMTRCHSQDSVLVSVLIAISCIVRRHLGMQWTRTHSPLTATDTTVLDRHMQRPPKKQSLVRNHLVVRMFSQRSLFSPRPDSGEIVYTRCHTRDSLPLDLPRLSTVGPRPAAILYHILPREYVLIRRSVLTSIQRSATRGGRRLFRVASFFRARSIKASVPKTNSALSAGLVMASGT